MRKLLALLLVLSLLLCGCVVNKPEDTEPIWNLDSTGDPTDSTDDTGGNTDTSDATDTTDETEASDATDATDETDATEPSEPEEPAYRHPLNGAALAGPWIGRPTAVMINNSRAALPQHGISQADILFELETEGGSTRCLAVFSDISKVMNLGPVRSARSYFVNLATAFQAPLIHCGGSYLANRGQYSANDADVLEKWEHIDEIYNSSYFNRDYDRYLNGGYAWEHTLFTNGTLITKALAAKKYAAKLPAGTDFGLTFRDDPEVIGTVANTVKVVFRYGKSTTMTYNKETGVYEASQHGEPWIDGNTKKALEFENVIVLYAKQSNLNPGASTVLSVYELQGSGTGHFACGGRAVKINWTRETVNDPYTFTLEDGTPLVLGAGASYIAIVDTSKTASYV